ncbi:MAG: NrsF family protein [Acetobacteraceae bacterium]
METDRLIAELARDLQPVRPLAPPGRRLLYWLLVSIPPAALLAWAFGFRPDLGQRFADPRFALEIAATFATALAAGYAAFCAGLPDQPAWKLWLPLAPLALWLATLGEQCVGVLIRMGPAGLRITPDAMCVPAIAVGGLVPAVAIVTMLRRGGRFRSTHACFCAALAAASLGAAALRFYHPVDAAVMVIVWQFGAVALLSLLAGGAARLMVFRHPRLSADGAV